MAHFKCYSIENYKLLWKESVFNSPKCLNYRIFKKEFQYDNYFNILPIDLAIYSFTLDL